MKRTGNYSLPGRRDFPTFLGGGGLSFIAAWIDVSRSCLGPKSLAISTPSLPREPGQPSTSCQISLISKVFPSPISLVSSTFLNPPPLTLREFVHGYSSVKFFFSEFSKKKNMKRKKKYDWPYIAQRIPLHKELFMKNEVSARREGKGREGRRAKRAMSRRCNRSHAPIRLKRTGVGIAGPVFMMRMSAPVVTPATEPASNPSWSRARVFYGAQIASRTPFLLLLLRL